MDRALALDLVDQAADLGVFGACSFTGGDPFVYYDDMLAISRRMAEYGLPFTVISACAWATDDDVVDEMLQPLIDAGMTSITASHDPSHEQWVPRQNIVRVVSRAVALGARAGIFGTFYDSTRLEDLFPEFADLEEVALEDRPVAFGVGRLKQTAQSRDAFQGRELGGEPTCYRRVYHDVTVFWDGEVYPCCSVYNRATPGISYGNVYATTLREIWDRIEGSLFLRIVKRSGFRDLYALLGQLDPELARVLPNPSNAAGACQLCNQLMSDTDMSRRVHEVLAREEQRRVERLMVQ
jgi:MoaA/NifB/PqqE/SkfB family radical SAM enzyme